jgi:arylsulfatase A-like enzyme
MNTFKKYFFVVLILSFTIGQAQKQSKPNVLFIMCDDLNDYQGAFGGHKQVHTPNIDKLAAAGITFLNAQSNAPVCQPSRNSIFTGVYPHDSKDYGWTPMLKQPVLKNNKTIIQLFKENGYYTLGSGKLTHGKPTKDWLEWGMNHKHNYGPLYNNGKKNVSHPTVPAPYNSIGPIDGSFGRLSDGGPSSGKRGEKGWVMGWDMKPMRYVNDQDRDLLQDEKHAAWAEDKFNELESKNNEQPFFMGIGFVRPHTPLHAPDKYFDRYPIDKINLDEWLPKDEKDTHWLENFDPKKKGPKYYHMLVESYNGDREIAMKHFLQAYLACVTFVDEQIGKVVDALNNSKFKNNTVIVFTSDHGWQMGEKNYLFKNSPWEESARVPLIIKTPGSKNGVKVTQPVSLVDIFPTLIDYCSITGDNKKNSNGGQLGGNSLRPLIEENDHKWEGPNGALTIVGNFGSKIPAEKQNFSYRTKDWRYILYSNGKEELYNHKKDTREWKNLATSKKHRKTKAKLKKEMMAIIYK